MRLTKGIIRIIFANIINLAISFGNGFLLPKYLSIETYAGLKMFLLYISYVGILHLGYIDGIYIKYGGKTSLDIDPFEVLRDKKTLAITQLIITIFVSILGIILNETNIFLVGLSILPVNMITFYKFVYQATGEFKLYSRITNVIPITIFLFNLLLLFMFKCDNAFFYAIIQVAVNYLIWIYYETKNRIKISGKMAGTDIISRIRENICAGVVIMLGNFMGIWITSIDRWFVKFFCNVEEFAFYAFAVTMLRLLNVVITAFSVTLYNFFCINSSRESVTKVRKYVLIIGAAIIILLFPLNYIILTYLPHYQNAIVIIEYLFAAQFVMIEINSVYTNLYKALNRQKQYFYQMIIITIVAVFTNVFFSVILKFEIKAFAIATFVTALIWLVLCQIELKDYILTMKEWIYIFLILGLYFFCGRYNAFAGGVLYGILLILVTVWIFFKEIKILTKYVKALFKEKIN